MTLNRLKQLAAEYLARIKTVYWPHFMLWLESHSPRSLFLRALLLGLLLSVPWQCSRLVYQHYFNADDAISSEQAPELSSPDPNTSGLTGMPRPGARRPVAAAPETATESPQTSTEQTAATPEPEAPLANTASNRDASVLQRVAPEYPASAVRKNESGTVLIRVELKANGEVKKVRVAQSSGSRALDRAAREAVSNWQFAPKLENGTAVESELQIPVDFNLGQ